MALENRRGRQENQAISAQVQGSSLRDILGPSRVIGKVVAEVERIAPTDFTVIILGETGVGKEVVAHAIHRLSHRAQDPFVPVDCGSIPPTLIEAELFGHEKGAFTGAERSQAGCFEAAQGGTLFLDEIGNLPANMQTKILRALQERLVRRVGSTTSIKVDVRVLAATNENLPGMVEKGDFRRDLFYRLNEFCIQVPPLRQRGEDIIYLARRFLELTGEELKKDNLEFSPAAVQEFLNHPWPGNVRELRNVVRRAVLLAEKFIEPEHLGLAVPGPGESPLLSPGETNRGGEDQDPFEGLPLKDIIRKTIVKTERKVLQQVLGETGGNMAEAARVLGVDYKTIRNKTREYQIVGFSKRDGP
jgi:two-component system nitrogen regulation response regulator GlnG